MEKRFELCLKIVDMKLDGKKFEGKNIFLK